MVNLKLAWQGGRGRRRRPGLHLHRRRRTPGYLSPFAFISAVRQFFDGIVTVGGAISDDGASIAGAVAAGADLVYMGTRFLASQESMAQPEYKQMVVDYGIDDVVVSDGITGTNASWLRPSLVDNGYDPDNMAFTGSRQYDAAGDGPSRWKDVWAAGQGLQTIGAVSSVAEIVDELAGEYAVAVDRLTTRREGTGQRLDLPGDDRPTYAHASGDRWRQRHRSHAGDPG